MSRDVINNFENKEETEGAGVKVRRSVGADEVCQLHKKLNS